MDKNEKAFRIYELFNERVFNEDRLLAERTMVFLLSSSVLFAGFVMLGDQATLIRVVLPLIGMFLSFLMGCVASASVHEVKLWLSCCRMIEQEECAFRDLKKEN